MFNVQYRVQKVQNIQLNKSFYELPAVPVQTP